MNKIAKMADEFFGEEFTMACFNSTQLYFHFGFNVFSMCGKYIKFFDKKVLDLTQDDFGSINILFESGEILKIIKSASYVEWIEVKYGDVIDYGENF